MGCNQSKAAEAAPIPRPSAGENGDKEILSAPSSKSNGSSRPSSPFAKKVHQQAAAAQPQQHQQQPEPSALYRHLLGGLDPAPSSSSSPESPSPGGDDDAAVFRACTRSFWEEARHLCASHPSLASHVDPGTGGTPLHVACSLGSTHVDVASVGTAAASCVGAMIDACPDAAGRRDGRGRVPLEGIFSGMAAGAGGGTKRGDDGAATSAAFGFRTEAAGMLLDREGGAVLLGGRVLYQIVERLPDDFDSPLGPTVELVRVLVERGRASARGAAALEGLSPGSRGEVDVDSILSEPVDDDVLALLYRRFVRQFDRSERFFEGDNSREEVVGHRRDFKNAAVNTFNVIELLLRRSDDSVEDNQLLVHNAVRSGACPPDLLRYLVETNLEAVAETDSRGNLPLHYAAGYEDAGTKAPESYSKYVIDELLYAYPEGAAVTNADGVLPIVLAIESGKKWIGGGVRSMHEAYPPGIEQAQLGDQHPLINAMSFQSREGESVVEPLEDQDDGDGTIATGVDGGGGRRRKRKQRRKIRKDESHDAIMFVQKPGAPVRDVVSTMWANEEDGGVQMLGCSALGLAAAGADEGGAIASVALLGVAAVVNAMKNHPNEPAVQEKACTALVAMAPADGVREVSFSASGAITTMVSAMQAHVGDATVQKEACRALRGVAARGGAETATVIASVSGFTAIVNAMGAHPEDGGVQREACATMEVLTGFRDAYLPELHEETDALLQSAATKFPEECLSPVDAICSRLNAADG